MSLWHDLPVVHPSILLFVEINGEIQDVIF